LEAIENDESSSPAVVLMPPDSGEFIRGNSGGFVRLAIASLRAAQGQPQTFRHEPWLGVDEQDWILQGLKPDTNAHAYLPKKKRGWLYDKAVLVLFACVGIVVLACFSIGLSQIIHSLFKR
jgi:hypothetical protein